MAKLSEIEGVGKVYADKLGKAGVKTVAKLLDKGATRIGRKRLADETGVSEKLVLKWVNRADLDRIKGISTQYADLLEYSGVNTIPDLARRNAENLEARMTAVNGEKKLVRKVPSLKQIQGWIEQASVLPRTITH